MQTNDVSSIIKLIPDISVSIVLASIVLLLVWFILSVKNINTNNEHFKELLRDAAELHDEMLFKQKHDEELFKQPPPGGDCPICFLRLPILRTGYKYYSCCGNIICSGCVYAPVYDDQGNEVDGKTCPFCRTELPESDEEDMAERLTKRIDVKDPIAIHDLGCCYRDGKHGFTQDHVKALELFHEAGELGHTIAHCNIGYAYEVGHGVEVDMKKANQYYELSAIGGCTQARYNLGNMEVETGNMDRALKHFMIGAESGYNDSLKGIQELYTDGYATKEDYTEALQLYQTYLGEIKSVQRDKAAADDEGNRYY